MFIKCKRGWVAPWWGFVGPRSAIFSGISSSTGFFLSDGLMHFKMPNYEISTPMAKEWQRIVIVFASFLIAVNITPYSGSLIPILINFLLLFYISHGILMLIILDRDTREWHACEHKSITLLESGLEATMENLKKCPAFLIDCGSSLMARNIQIAFFILIAMSMPEPYLIPGVLIVVILCLLGASLNFIRKRLRRNPSRLLLILASITFLPVFLIPILMEFMVLRKPSEEKYEKTLRFTKAVASFI